MKNKIATLFDCIKTLCESDIERIISFVLGIVSANQQPDRPACPHCGHAHVIKYGHTKENSVSSAMAAGRLSCIPPARWHIIPISAVPYGRTLSATRWTAKPWMIQRKDWASRTRPHSICGIRSSWPSRICWKRNQPSFPVSQSSMKLLCLTAIRGNSFLRRSAAPHADMEQKPQSAESQVNMSQSAPASSVTGRLWLKR